MAAATTTGYHKVPHESLQERKRSPLYRLRECINGLVTSVFHVNQTFDSVLDLGCGNGGGLMKFRRQLNARHYTGRDVDRGRIEECKRRASTVAFESVDAQVADLSCAEQWPAGKYDFIYVGFAIHYFALPLPVVFRLLHDRLRAGGKIVIVYPNYTVIQAYWKRAQSNTCSLGPLCTITAMPGTQYRFTLGDRVQGAVENGLTSYDMCHAATDAGFKIGSSCNLNVCGSGLAELDANERDIVSLYSVIVLCK